MENIYKNLIKIQEELKAPKSNYNSFGKYSYRSCEDILEAVKPICRKYNTVLILSDKVVNVGSSNYIEATATLINIENPEEVIQNTALARESTEKKGMDDSQITGTASSYARKYALNGLFNIDDTKDADTDEYHEQTTKKTSKKETKIEDIDIEAKVGFGKYKDMTWIELNATNPHYMDWLVKSYEQKGETEKAKLVKSIVEKIKSSYIAIEDDTENPFNY